MFEVKSLVGGERLSVGCLPVVITRDFCRAIRYWLEIRAWSIRDFWAGRPTRSTG